MRATAAVAVAAIVFAGCGGGRHPAPTPTRSAPPHRTAPSDDQLIEDVLHDRADALASGNRRAYLMTSAPRRRRADSAAFDRAAALPLRAVTMDVAALDVTGTRAAARVRERYGIERIAGTFESTRRLELVKRGGRWRVAAVRGARGFPPWEVGRFSVRRTPHFIVLVPQGIAPRELLATLESGYRAMKARLLRGHLRRRYLVVAAADAAQARTLTRQIRGVETIAAISDATISEQGPARAVSKVIALRLLVVMSAFADLDTATQRRTIAHELTHAALASLTSGRTPAWLVEGVAMYVSGDRRAAPPGADLAALSRPLAIARLGGLPQARAYAASSAAAFAIADRFGARRLLALYNVFNDASLRGKPGPRLVDRALRRVLGIGLRSLP